VAEKAASRSPRLDAMLERMIAEGASDLHLSAAHRPHWRVDGEMQALKDAGVLAENEVQTLLEPVMEARHLEQFRTEGDADFAYAIPGVARFRVNVFKDHRGVNAVFRLIPSKILSLEQLGLPPVIQNFCDMPKGLVLVTGPTGSGKSTTLAAMIDSMNRNQKLHVETIEDRIVPCTRASRAHQPASWAAHQELRRLRAALRGPRRHPGARCATWRRSRWRWRRPTPATWFGHAAHQQRGAVDRVIDQFPAGQQEQVRSTLPTCCAAWWRRRGARPAAGGWPPR
jgi:twitching motility protein PilT